MRYEVIKTFRDLNGAMLAGGVDTVEADASRANKLRSYGLIGRAVTETAEKSTPQIHERKPVETATKSANENRKQGKNK